MRAFFMIFIGIIACTGTCIACGPQPPDEKLYVGSTPGGIQVFDDLLREEVLQYTIAVEQQMNVATGVTLRGYYVYFRDKPYLVGTTEHPNAGGWTIPELKAIEVAYTGEDCLGKSGLVHELTHGYQYVLDGVKDYEHTDPTYWAADITGAAHGLSIRFSLWAQLFFCDEE